MPVRILIAAMLAFALYGCGLQSEDTPPGPPIPDTNREHQGPGTPLFLFGQGNRVRGFQTDDEQYREYLLWKEWQEYQNYLKWQRTQQEQGAATSQGGQTQ